MAGTLQHMVDEHLFQIRPNDALWFPDQGSSGRDLHTTILLRNDTLLYVAYKVKSTNGYKYRVKGNSGVLSPHSAALVHVYLNILYKHLVTRKDKFLIVATLASGNNVNVHKLIEEADQNETVQKTLTCSVLTSSRRMTCRSESRLGSGGKRHPRSSSLKRSRSLSDQGTLSTLFCEALEPPDEPEDRRLELHLRRFLRARGLFNRRIAMVRMNSRYWDKMILVAMALFAVVALGFSYFYIYTYETWGSAGRL